MSQPKISRVQKYNTEAIPHVEIETEENETVEETHHLSFFNKLIIFLFLFIIGTLSYATLIAPHLIDVKEYKVETPLLPFGMNGLKIVHFSDVHYSNSINKKNLDRIVTKINKLKPDVIIFTGDLISKDIEIDDTIKKEVIDSLSKLECSLEKYAIHGDEDNEVYTEIMNSTNFNLIDNTSKLLYYNDSTPIVITGLGKKDTHDYTILNSPVEETDIIGYYQIVLIHEPDPIDNFLNYQPDLVLGGHTLGGSIKLPFTKPLFLPKNGTKYYEDFYQLNDTKFYISNGLGTSSISMRLNNHPSINLYRLYTPKESN